MKLRPATMEDCEILFAWRNDPATRLASRYTAPITLDEHRNWLVESLDNANRALYVAELEGTPVGTVRTDIIGGVAEISWTVAPEHRGKGIGKLMVCSLAQSVSGPMRAHIKSSNAASMKIARAAGMSLESTDGEMHWFQRD